MKKDRKERWKGKKRKEKETNKRRERKGCKKGWEVVELIGNEMKWNEKGIGKLSRKKNLRRKTKKILESRKRIWKGKKVIRNTGGCKGKERYTEWTESGEKAEV